MYEEKHTGTAQYAANAVNQIGRQGGRVDGPVAESAVAQLMNDLDYVNQLVKDLLASQKRQLDRLFGGKPESPEGLIGNMPAMGSLGVLNNQITTLRAQISSALDNQSQLERIG
jgi:Asp-tRNA(Asn)/Glu-tRNA(Gln) amidotransferase B subunit